MADQKITQLTDLATLDNADIVPVVDDVAGTPITKKFTFTTLKAFLKTYFDTLYTSGGWTKLATGTFSGATNATFTADDTTDIITSNGHGLVDGDKVTVSNSGGGLPGGLAAATGYFVRDATANTFKLSANPYDTAINITTAGTGTHTWTNAKGAIILSFTAKKYLKIKGIINTPTISSMVRITVNGDGTATYGWSTGVDGGAPSAAENQKFWDRLCESMESLKVKIIDLDITNIATQRKRAVTKGYQGDQGNEAVGQSAYGGYGWENTTDQITSINVWLNTAANMAVGSVIDVYGMD